MTEHEREGLTAMCLIAAFAESEMCAAERERTARIAADLGGAACRSRSGCC